MLAEVRLPFARFLLLMPALEATYIQLNTDTKHCSGCSILQHIACKFSAHYCRDFVHSVKEALVPLPIATSLSRLRRR